jgi:hypothetical protein
MTEILLEDVHAAFNTGGYTINERFEECGFVYFPTGTKAHLEGERGRNHPDQGRVFWRVKKHDYPDTILGRVDRDLDKKLGQSRDELSIGVSWGRATDRQMSEIAQMLKLYVLYRRQEREKRAEVVA